MNTQVNRVIYNVQWIHYSTELYIMYNEYANQNCEFDSHPWRGALDTTLCDNFSKGPSLPHT
jgi:hypothetical protein